MNIFLRLSFLLLVVCWLSMPGMAELGERPALPEGTPDFTKGEGEKLEDVGRGQWYLHCSGARGHMYLDELGDGKLGRQILVTEVPKTSSVRRDLKVGDVILGVNGEYFSDHAVYEFRRTSVPANRSGGSFDVILWRPGWDKERSVTLSLAFLPVDLTKGEERDEANDWNLGPTGARGWMQGRGGQSLITRQILITEVEEGSPADGVLAEGDVLLGVEGKPFTYNARRALVDAINRAETRQGEGKLSLHVWRDGEIQDMIVTLPVLGSYSATAPWDCAKTEKILQQALDYMVEKDEVNRYPIMDGRGQVAALALLATGEEKYIEMAKKRIYAVANIVDTTEYPPDWMYATWGYSYANLLLTEYYLMTGDEKVFPALEKLSIMLAEGQSAGGSWGHRFSAEGDRYIHGYGALNAVGNVAWISIVLAQRCGVDHPELDRAVYMGKHYLENFVDTRTVPYGDALSVDSRRPDDNGKNSTAACGFAFLGDRAGTSYYTRMVISSHTWREWGHTGVWWSHLWGPLSAVRAGKPAAIAFLNEVNFLFDLERRWDGGFIYQGKIGIGYGINDQGRQIVGSEHTTPHWDTTAGRVLMYCLPRKELYLTGNGGITVVIPEDEVASVIEAGHGGPNGNWGYQRRYDDRSVSELLELLTSWSPTVRSHAASSLARTDNPTEQIPVLLDMLESDNRFARYGACQALRHMNAGSDDVVDALLPLLESDDHVLQRQALVALGKSGNNKALKPLLKMAIAEHENDPLDRIHRTVAVALFDDGGLLHESIDGVDRDLLIPATRNLLSCKGGVARMHVTRGVINKLTLDELETLWPDLKAALLEFPGTEVVAGSNARADIAKLLAENKIEEGMTLLLQYMNRQRPHGAKPRLRMVTDWIKSYGAAAKPMLPALEEYLAYLKQDHVHKDITRPSRKPFYRSQIPYIEEAIESIQNATETPETISIQEHLN